MTTEEFFTYQEQTFDSFCKSVIRNESVNAHKQLAVKAEKETQLSALSPKDMSSLYTEDTYRYYCKTFYVKGTAVNVYDQPLGEVLQHLTPQRRDVVLLYFFMDYNEAEIARILQITSPAVHNRKTAALRRLRELLEDPDNA